MTQPTINTDQVNIQRVSTGEYSIGYHRWDAATGEFQYTVYIAHCAGAIIFLTQLLFAKEASEDIVDKHDESDAIAAMVLSDMRDNPSKFIPKKAP